MTHDMMTPAELSRAGRMSARDAKLLRAISGRSTFAEWCDGRRREPYRITDERLLLVCAVVARARENARFLARHAPTALIGRPS